MDTNNKFFTFIKPYINFIDDKKIFKLPFRWLYIFLAAVNLLLPFYLLYKMLEMRLFSAGGKMVFVLILLWLVIAFVSWVCAQLWWDRQAKVLAFTEAGNEFPATYAIAHFVQCVGEWLGTFIAVVGFATALLANIFLRDEMGMLSGMAGVDLGVTMIIFFPVYGFFTLVFGRFLSETIRVLPAIANNTKR